VDEKRAIRAVEEPVPLGVQHPEKPDVRYLPLSRRDMGAFQACCPLSYLPHADDGVSPASKRLGIANGRAWPARSAVIVAARRDSEAEAAFQVAGHFRFVYAAAIFAIFLRAPLSFASSGTHAIFLN
jgi:hypothetical protein